MMNKIKTHSKACSLCGSKDTDTYAVWNGKQYVTRVDCNNINCVSNIIKNGN